MDTDCLIVQKSNNLKGEIVIPPSKSHTLRAIIFATLAYGNSVIKNSLDCADARFCIAACRKLGAEIRALRNSAGWFIKGVGGRIKTPKSEINVGNSGITLRFLSGIFANCRKEAVITGGRSIRANRPMQPMIDALGQLGVEVRSVNKNGFAPIAIRGPMTKNRTVVLGEDSQFISGLLIGSLLAEHDIVMEVKNPGEKPWVDMTLHWFKKLGLRYERKNYGYYKVFGGQNFSGFDAIIPADFSSAAYPIVAALITEGSKITLKGLDRNNCQGDKEVVDVLKRMGGKIFWRGNDLIVESSRLKGIEIDVNDFIDAVSILAVAGCYAEGVTRIKNAAIARTKECNRLAAIVKELSKMGANIKETADGLEIRKSVLRGAAVDSHDDHRMVFSLAIASLGVSGSTKISNAGCVSKTIPNFVELMRNVGAEIKKNEGTKNIIIAGLKASGKSTIGRLVAQKLNVDFIDTDEELEKLYWAKSGKKMTFREIYRRLGEEKFRRLELEVINNLICRQNFIISIGGGALMKVQMRDKIKELGHIVFLDAPPKVLYERIIKEKELPVFLSPKNLAVSFEKMYNERRPVYLANCDTVLDLSKISVNQAKQTIIKKAKRLGFGK